MYTFSLVASFSSFASWSALLYNVQSFMYLSTRALHLLFRSDRQEHQLPAACGKQTTLCVCLMYNIETDKRLSKAERRSFHTGERQSQLVSGKALCL